MAKWADLQAMREQGLRPSLPVMITTDGKPPAQLLREDGMLVIEHKPGELFPVELLDGLRVLLFLGSCDRAQAVVRAMLNKHVKPTDLRAWCPCFQCLDIAPVHCAVAWEWAA